MADGKRMSDYAGIDEAPQLTPAEKAYYKQNALVTAVGKINDGASTPYSNYNIPLSEIAPSVPVTDVTVNGSSVVSDGVAAVTVPTVPTATDLAGDGLTANAGKLDVSNKVPAPTATTDRGKVLSVATDSDNIVWTAPATVPEISQYNGDVSAINATNDSSSGGYVFDVNLDTDTLEKRRTTGENQYSYIAVKNPVPATTGTNEGDVLTVDANGDIGWATPSGGGGGGGSVDIVDIVAAWNPDYFDPGEGAFVFQSATKTPQECWNLALSGKSLVLRVIQKASPTSQGFNSITFLPLSFMYELDGEIPTLYFNYGEGSGGQTNTVTGSTNPILHCPWQSDLFYDPPQT